jgi:ATP-dependent DNA helicase RecQ
MKAYAVALYHQSDITELEQGGKSLSFIDFIKRTYQSLANYYQIATGSGYLSSFDFELDTFTETYKLPSSDTYYALKRLEDEGFIQFNEAFYSPSKVYFQVDKKQLYEFQVANASFDLLIKMMLRMYGGELFTSFIVISEYAVARQLQVQIADIEKMLSALHQYGLIVYDKQKDKPQITFTTVRFNAADMPLQSRHLQARKQQELDKVQAVINYVVHRKRCRTLLLLEYFDELSDKECGVCDICLEKKKQKDYTDYYQQNRQKVLEVLSNQEISLQQLVYTIKPKNEKMFLDTIREMAGMGEVKYAANGNIYRAT